MKFLHTADLQIGMKCSPARSRADEARRERLKTVDRIVDVANRFGVDFVLIAGDLFDHRTPKAGDFAMVVAALKRLRMPAFVLPGNHDPAGKGGPYASPAWTALLDSQVTTIEVPGMHQVLTIAELFEGKGIDYPTRSQRTDLTLKKANKVVTQVQALPFSAPVQPGREEDDKGVAAIGRDPAKAIAMTRDVAPTERQA